MRVLFVTPYVPSPIRVRPFELLRALVAAGFDVTVLCTAGADEAGAVAELRQQQFDLRTVAVSGRDRLTAVVAGSLRGRPLQAAYGVPAAFRHALRALLAERSFDIVHLEHLRAAALIDELQGVPLVYDAVDCISLLLERTRAAGPTLQSRLIATLELHRTRRFEAAICSAAAVTVVTSPEDAGALRQLAPGAAIEVVPNGVDLQRFGLGDEPRVPDSVVFTGKMSYHANIAAARRLVERIMPSVWQRRPTARLTIVGSSPPPKIQAYAADPRITVTGRVPEIAPYLRAAAVAASPLAYGVGVQNKVLEAMATATPVVVDRQSLTALQARAGHDVLVAADDEHFAAAITGLLADAELARRVGSAGRAYVERFHRWPESTALLATAYRRAAQRPTRRATNDTDAIAGVEVRGTPL